MIESLKILMYYIQDVRTRNGMQQDGVCVVCVCFVIVAFFVGFAVEICNYYLTFNILKCIESRKRTLTCIKINV